MNVVNIDSYTIGPNISKPFSINTEIIPGTVRFYDGRLQVYADSSWNAISIHASAMIPTLEDEISRLSDRLSTISTSNPELSMAVNNVVKSLEELKLLSDISQ